MKKKSTGKKKKSIPLKYDFEKKKYNVDLLSMDKNQMQEYSLYKSFKEYVKKWWVHLSTWKKGAIIGVIFGILYSTMLISAIISSITYESHPIFSRILLNDLTFAPMEWGGKIVRLYGCYTSPCFLDAMVVSLPFYGVIGALIGLIIGKVMRILLDN